MQQPKKGMCADYLGFQNSPGVNIISENNIHPCPCVQIIFKSVSPVTSCSGSCRSGCSSQSAPLCCWQGAPPHPPPRPRSRQWPWVGGGARSAVQAAPPSHNQLPPSTRPPVQDSPIPGKFCLILSLWVALPEVMLARNELSAFEVMSARLEPVAYSNIENSQFWNHPHHHTEPPCCLGGTLLYDCRPHKYKKLFNTTEQLTYPPHFRKNWKKSSNSAKEEPQRTIQLSQWLFHKGERKWRNSFSKLGAQQHNAKVLHNPRKSKVPP